MIFALVAGAAVGALAFRVRGGWLGDLWGVPGQSSRLLYAALMAAVMLGAGWPWPVDGWRLALLFVAFVAAWFIGAVALGTLGSIDSGRNPDKGDGRHPRLRDFAMNSLRGAAYALPAAIVLAVFRAVYGHPDAAWWAAALPLAGLLQGPAYEASWRLRRMEQRPTELAEWLTGAALGLGAALAALAPGA